MFILFCSVLLLAGCDRRSGGVGAQNAGIQISVAVSPQPLAVGPAQVTVTLQDKNGQPIKNAQVEIEGNMSHAGMTPVFAATVEDEGGRYVTQDFTFTMAGDWFLTVRATLPDGQTVEQTFALNGVEETDGP